MPNNIVGRKDVDQLYSRLIELTILTLTAFTFIYSTKVFFSFFDFTFNDRNL